MIRTGRGIVKGELVIAAIEIIDEMGRKPLNRLAYVVPVRQGMRVTAG